MKDNKDQNLEKLVDKLMHHDGLEQPSNDFTSQVMQHIESLEKSKATVYKPLIPKPVWYAIAIGMVVLVGFLYSSSTVDSQSSWLPQVNYDALFHNGMTNIVSAFKFSTTTMYVLGLFAIMLCIQIPLLKNYMDRRLS